MLESNLDSVIEEQGIRGIPVLSFSDRFFIAVVIH